MRREEALAALRGYLPAIRHDFGVRRIALFGSTARDEAHDDSDLDILVEFEVTPTFDSFMGLKFFLDVAAERLARRLRKSRSQLYTEAVTEYVAHHEPDTISEAMDRLAEEVDTRLGEFGSAAAGRVLEGSKW